MDSSPTLAAVFARVDVELDKVGALETESAVVRARLAASEADHSAWREEFRQLPKWPHPSDTGAKDG